MAHTLFGSEAENKDPQRLLVGTSGSHSCLYVVLMKRRLKLAILPVPPGTVLPWRHSSGRYGVRTIWFIPSFKPAFYLLELFICMKLYFALIWTRGALPVLLSLLTRQPYRNSEPKLNCGMGLQIRFVAPYPLR